MSDDLLHLSAAGKYLICGEYVVLDRGIAAALPAGRASLQWEEDDEWQFCFRYASREIECGLEGADERTAGWLAPRIAPLSPTPCSGAPGPSAT